MNHENPVHSSINMMMHEFGLNEKPNIHNMNDLSLPKDGILRSDSKSHKILKPNNNSNNDTKYSEYIPNINTTLRGEINDSEERYSPTVLNIDQFLSSFYRFYHRGGYYHIVSQELFKCASLLILIIVSFALFVWVNWTNVFACITAEHCSELSFFYAYPFDGTGALWAIVVVLYFGIFLLYYMAQLFSAHCIISDATSMRRFYRTLGVIDDAHLNHISWDELVLLLTRYQEKTPFCRKQAKLNVAEITAIVLREANWLTFFAVHFGTAPQEGLNYEINNDKNPIVSDFKSDFAESLLQNSETKIYNDSSVKSNIPKRRSLTAVTHLSSNIENRFDRKYHGYSVRPSYAGSPYEKTFFFEDSSCKYYKEKGSDIQAKKKTFRFTNYQSKLHSSGNFASSSTNSERIYQSKQSYKSNLKTNINHKKYFVNKSDNIESFDSNSYRKKTFPTCQNNNLNQNGLKIRCPNFTQKSLFSVNSPLNTSEYIKARAPPVHIKDNDLKIRGPCFGLRTKLDKLQESYTTEKDIPLNNIRNVPWDEVFAHTEVSPSNLKKHINNKSTSLPPLPRWLPKQILFTKAIWESFQWVLSTSLHNEQGRVRDLDAVGGLSTATLFRVVGILDAILMLPLLIFLLMFLISQHAQEFRMNRPLSFLKRAPSGFANLFFRGFNELPHMFEARMARCNIYVDNFVNQHRNDLQCSQQVSVLEGGKRLLQCVSGAFLAVLVLVGVIDDRPLLYINLWGKNLLWYLTILGFVLTVVSKDEEDDESCPTRNIEDPRSQLGTLCRPTFIPSDVKALSTDLPKEAISLAERYFTAVDIAVTAQDLAVPPLPLKILEPEYKMINSCSIAFSSRHAVQVFVKHTAAYFAHAFPFRYQWLLWELAGVLLAPLVLCWYLAPAASRIVAMVRENAIRGGPLGDWCKHSIIGTELMPATDFTEDEKEFYTAYWTSGENNNTKWQTLNNNPIVIQTVASANRVLWHKRVYGSLRMLHDIVHCGVPLQEQVEYLTRCGGISIELLHLVARIDAAKREDLLKLDATVLQLCVPKRYIGSLRLWESHPTSSAPALDGISPRSPSADKLLRTKHNQPIKIEPQSNTVMKPIQHKFNRRRNIVYSYEQGRNSTGYRNQLTSQITASPVSVNDITHSLTRSISLNSEDISAFANIQYSNNFANYEQPHILQDQFKDFKFNGSHKRSFSCVTKQEQRRESSQDITQNKNILSMLNTSLTGPERMRSLMNKSLLPQSSKYETKNGEKLELATEDRQEDNKHLVEKLISPKTKPIIQLLQSAPIAPKSHFHNSRLATKSAISRCEDALIPKFAELSTDEIELKTQDCITKKLENFARFNRAKIPKKVKSISKQVDNYTNKDVTLFPSSNRIAQPTSSTQKKFKEQFKMNIYPKKSAYLSSNIPKQLISSQQQKKQSRFEMVNEFLFADSLIYQTQKLPLKSSTNQKSNVAGQLITNNTKNTETSTSVPSVIYLSEASLESFIYFFHLLEEYPFRHEITYTPSLKLAPS